MFDMIASAKEIREIILEADSKLKETSYEDLLYTNYQMVSAMLQGMYMLAVKDKDMKRAHMLSEKQDERF